ncbi:phosphotriesterase family protein [Kineococcus rubinsiae]|uniref:phosphotriesterase family protein n=1 Tax=Kineococcus rubinsiae TaxID=2609562 RepID=UPI0014320669|nr:esterase [Kineococcus rubinsiae]NIZ90268.1 esterase [Kineococcus rubinsiae]
MAEPLGTDAREPRLHTTLGPLRAQDVGLVLPHEHLLVDFRPAGSPGFAQADPVEFASVVEPLLAGAAAAGVTALVECTPPGLGRRVDLVLDVSCRTGVPVVVATGVYREPWVPDWVYGASDDELEAWMHRELTEGVDDSGVLAGFIKISAAEDGIRPVEERVVRAAARAAARTGALVGSHTTDGAVVLGQIDLAVAEGLAPDRFLSIHTQTIPDPALRQAIVDRGAWIEFDDVGQADDARTLQLVLDSLEAGQVGRVLLSHDAGWFDPALPGGGTPRPFTHLTGSFLPALRAAGVGQDVVDELCVGNPFRAFGR